MKAKVKITANTTHYKSPSVSKLLNEIIKHNLKTNLLKQKLFNVSIGYDTNEVRASVTMRNDDSANILIRLPKKIELFNRSNSLRKANHLTGVFDADESSYSSKEISFEQDVAQKFTWCLDSCRGVQKSYSALKNYDVSYVKSTIETRKEKEPPTKKEIAINRVKTLLERKKDWKSKMKRAENALKKLDREIVRWNKKANEE